jgi:hypothetical protein
MCGIQTKAANVTVLALEGAGPASVDAGWAVHGGGLRRTRQLEHRRRQVLVIAHSNDNARLGSISPRLWVVRAPSADGFAGVEATSEGAGR